MGQSINGRGQGQSNMISYCSKNLNSLIIETVQVFERLKNSEWICIIVWLCPHTAKTHLYANCSYSCGGLCGLLLKNFTTV